MKALPLEDSILINSLNSLDSYLYITGVILEEMFNGFGMDIPKSCSG